MMTLIEYTASAGDTVFSFASIQIDPSLSDMVVLINDVFTHEFTIDWDNKDITLNNPAADGDKIMLLRVTSIVDPIVTFTDTAIITDNDLNNATLQNLFRLQEILEQIQVSFSPLDIELASYVLENRQAIVDINQSGWVTNGRIGDQEVSFNKCDFLDTDGTFQDASDEVVPTQKAAKDFINVQNTLIHDIKPVEIVGVPAGDYTLTGLSTLFNTSGGEIVIGGTGDYVTLQPGTYTITATINITLGGSEDDMWQGSVELRENTTNTLALKGTYGSIAKASGVTVDSTVSLLGHILVDTQPADFKCVIVTVGTHGASILDNNCIISIQKIA